MDHSAHKGTNCDVTPPGREEATLEVSEFMARNDYLPDWVQLNFIFLYRVFIKLLFLTFFRKDSGNLIIS